MGQKVGLSLETIDGLGSPRKLIHFLPPLLPSSRPKSRVTQLAIRCWPDVHSIKAKTCAQVEIGSAEAGGASANGNTSANNTLATLLPPSGWLLGGGGGDCFAANC